MIVEGSDLTVRRAVVGDLERVAEFMHGDPGPETAGIIGDRDLAAAFGKGLVELEGIPNAAKPTIVAQLGDLVVGVLQYTIGTSDAGVTLARARLALRVAGPTRLVHSLPRLRARQRVDLPSPPGAFFVAELHVDAALRNRGIGGHLLDVADREATKRGLQRLALTTYATNLARHLYERHGYSVTRRRYDRRYERYTGTPGRVLMEKTLPDTTPDFLD